MVSINGREVLRLAINILSTHYNRCLTGLFHGRPTGLGRSSSFVHPNPGKPPVPKLAPLPAKRTWTQATPNARVPKDRKQGRVKRKRYNDLAKDNSTIFIPGGFHKEPKETKRKNCRRRKDRHEADEPIDCDLETADGAQAGPAFKEQCEQRSNREAVDENEAFVMKQLNSLLFDKFKREGEFEAREVSDRVKGQAAERKARLREETEEAEILWRMRELERREEKERADRWRDLRLAQLEREKGLAESELAREKAERKQAKLQKVFKEQQHRHKEEECWEGLVERDTDNAFRRACNERVYTKQEKEEERVRRIHAENVLRLWRVLMREYFPLGQQQQDPGQQQEQPPRSRRPPSPKAQLQLYEKKWQVLRSGLGIDGTKFHLISFSQIPWPVINRTPTDPSQILPEHVQEFLMHPLRNHPDKKGKRKTKRMMAGGELLKWHPDKFQSIVLSKVREEDKEAASEAAGMIARVLTNALG